MWLEMVETCPDLCLLNLSGVYQTVTTNRSQAMTVTQLGTGGCRVELGADGQLCFVQCVKA